MRTAQAVTAIVLLMFSAFKAEAAILWYNGDADGVASYANQNNAEFQQILYNDFTVTGNGWLIDSVWSNNIFLNGPPASTTASWEIRSEMPTGALIASGNSSATLTLTGFQQYEYNTDKYLDEYKVLVTGLSVNLAPGTYWLAVYADNTNGSRAGNDTTSGTNSVGRPEGNNGNMYVSYDGGNTFQLSQLDTSAGIGGSELSSVPEPATVVIWSLGAIAVALMARRRTSA